MYNQIYRYICSDIEMESNDQKVKKNTIKNIDSCSYINIEVDIARKEDRQLYLDKKGDSCSQIERYTYNLATLKGRQLQLA